MDAFGQWSSLQKSIFRRTPRRLASRTVPPSDLWVYWHYERHGDLSRVHDLSIGGLLIETPEAVPVGETIELNFLAQEGHIGAKAVVRHLGKALSLAKTLGVLTFTPLTMLQASAQTVDFKV